MKCQYLLLTSMSYRVCITKTIKPSATSASFNWTFNRLIADPSCFSGWLCVTVSRNLHTHLQLISIWYVLDLWVDSRPSKSLRHANTPLHFIFLLLFYCCWHIVHTYIHTRRHTWHGRYLFVQLICFQTPTIPCN